MNALPLMPSMLPVMFWLFEFIQDIIFVIKVFVLLTIISFILNHVGKGPLSIVLIIGFAYFMLFSPFSWFFEWTYVLMILLMFGISGILIDFFFVSGGAAGAGAGAEGPISHGTDLSNRVAAIHRGRSIAGNMMRRFRGR